jgi:hypothetical protein
MHLPLRLVSEDYCPTTARAARAKASPAKKRAAEVVDEFGIGQQDLAVIYMSPSLYHEAFVQTMDLRKFDLSHHKTAGLEFYESDKRLQPATIKHNNSLMRCDLNGHTNVDD